MNFPGLYWAIHWTLFGISSACFSPGQGGGYLEEEAPFVGSFGKILTVTGNVRNTVTLFDIEDNSTCLLKVHAIHEFPLKGNAAGVAGGLITTEEGLRPLICGGKISHSHYTNKCYLLQSEGWKEVHTLSNGTKDMGAVSLDNKWIFFSGGNTGLVLDDGLKTTFLLNSQGQQISVPDLSQERVSPCNVILHSNESATVVGILGGWPGNHLQTKTMMRYSCSKDELPSCTKLANGPDMNVEKADFGCGTLQTSEGGRVLLAMRDYRDPTEILDLTKEDSTWFTLPGNKDVPGPKSGGEYSLVTSNGDPTTAYYIPGNRNYIFRVKCDNAQSCNFQKISTPFKIPSGSVSMAIPNEAGLIADATSCW